MAKILVAEDDGITRGIIEHVLKLNGFEVVTAADGEAAFALARKEKPDLLLMDVMMPFMNGIEVLRGLKESDEAKDVPVILLTAKGGDFDITAGFEAGASDYVVKPFSVAELMARVRKALRE
jgi:DNA-binding response OmpR family regulator